MGHLNSRGAYRKLGKKINNMMVKAPWNETFYNVMRELYTIEEADVITKMPYTFSNFDRISRITQYNGAQLQKIIESLTSKGFVFDICINDEYHYMPSPLVVGIFECAMMKTGNDVRKTKKLAKLFHAYIQDQEDFYEANLNHGEQVSFIRSLPHEETIKSSDFVEILDYEKASAIVKESDKFSIGICSCRHTMLQANEKKCDVPLNTCSQFGFLADFTIRNNIAKEVSRSEMLENLARSKELGLVLNADNVKKNVTFMCQCCRCCCHVLLGISKFGYPNTDVTSSLIAETDRTLCTGCGKCATACPIHAIEMILIENPQARKRKEPMIDESICLGCGVCALQCKTHARTMTKRGQRVIHPETTFERVILQCLERGTLQNQLFDNPQSITQKFMRSFIGGFFKLSPVKKAFMSDILRSSFLNTLKKGAKMQGRLWITEL